MRGRTARAATMHSAQRLARSDDDPPLFLFSTMSEVVVPLETQGRSKAGWCTDIFILFQNAHVAIAKEKLILYRETRHCNPLQ